MRKFLGEYLLEKGLITENQLKEAISEAKATGSKVGEVLVRRGLVSEEVIAKTLSEQLGFSFVDIGILKIEESVLKLIPVSICDKFTLIPLSKEGNSLMVAMANPLDMGAVDELTSIFVGLRIKPVVATVSAIKQAIGKYYKKSVSYQPPVAKTEAYAQVSRIEEKKEFGSDSEASNLIQEAQKASVIKLVQQLFEDAVKLGASDIHLEPQEKAFYCRFRVDGILQEVPCPPKELQAAVLSRIKIIAEMDIAQGRLPQDGRIQMNNILGKQIDFRVASFPTIYGEHISIRLLDKSQGIVKLEELGFSENILKNFKEIIRKPYGIILVTGPTGSGKTTTLYAALNTVNDLKKNIVTLEDPVEYTIARVHQAQVNVKAGLTFAAGMRSILRVDPDIIMIGEIRDQETADIAIHASLTGHLIFSTLHTNDAASAATRLVDIGVEPYLVASSLTGILAQRLVRRLCSKCKKEYKPTAAELESLKLLDYSREPIFFQSIGCSECRNTGYKGRIGIFELLIPDDEIRELIIKKSSAHKIKEVFLKKGNLGLRQDGLNKAALGLTTLTEVLSATESAR